MYVVVLLSYTGKKNQEGNKNRGGGGATTSSEIVHEKRPFLNLFFLFVKWSTSLIFF